MASYHDPKVNEYQRHYRETHRVERQDAENKRRKLKHQEITLQKRNAKLELKKRVLSHYGNEKLACIYCGFDNMDALSIDHIHGGGAKHRRSLGRAGRDFYLWLERNNYPEGFQTLCMNCQFIKRFANDREQNRTYAY